MPAFPPFAKPIEIQVNHRRGVERERLAKDEAADDSYAEWPPQLAVMRWRVDSDLLRATDRLEAVFGLLTTFRLVITAVVALVPGELDEVKGELTPMSP